MKQYRDDLPGARPTVDGKSAACSPTLTAPRSPPPAHYQKSAQQKAGVMHRKRKSLEFVLFSYLRPRPHSRFGLPRGSALKLAAAASSAPPPPPPRLRTFPKGSGVVSVTGGGASTMAAFAWSPPRPSSRGWPCEPASSSAPGRASSSCGPGECVATSTRFPFGGKKQKSHI